MKFSATLDPMGNHPDRLLSASAREQVVELDRLFALPPKPASDEPDPDECVILSREVYSAGPKRTFWRAVDISLLAMPQHALLPADIDALVARMALDPYILVEPTRIVEVEAVGASGLAFRVVGAKRRVSALLFDLDPSVMAHVTARSGRDGGAR